MIKWSNMIGLITDMDLSLTVINIAVTATLLAVSVQY
jgi:hypothetical protein